MPSIRRTLLVWILSALSLGAVLITLVTYAVTLDEMNEVFDDDLRNIAQAVGAYHHANHDAGGDPPLPLRVRTDRPEDDEIVTLTWTAEGRRVFSSDARVHMPFIAVEGLSRPKVDGEEWIVYSNVQPSGVAQAAQRLSARKDMASESAAKTLPPLLGLVVAVGALLVFALRRGLRPLDAAAADIGRRGAGSLDPLPTAPAPAELLPLVNAINALMRQLGHAFGAQRRFFADAAHELRTPISALRLQLQWLQKTGDEAERQRGLAELAAGVDRAQRLVRQLLQLARSEPEGEAATNESVDLAELVRAQVAALSREAEHGGLDLGARAPTPVPTLGNAAQLSVLIENLIENALRYTPAGGIVDVCAAVEQGTPVLRVIDDGPGIPEPERARAFERFHRGDAARVRAKDGSGLGLAIVKAIAQRHRASVELLTPASGRGLEVCVRFP